MGRKLTPERQKLKQEALSLRYDYGLIESAIVAKLGIPQTTISYWLSNNSRRDGSNNFANITHLEGDCLEILPTLPDKSVDVLLTDPPYSIMNDYGWTERRIVDHLHLAKTTIHEWLVGNSHKGLVGNNTHITHLEGDCLEILPTLPEESIEGEGFTIDLAWLRESQKTLKWTDDTMLTFIISQYKVSGTSVTGALNKLTREQAEDFVNQINKRLEKQTSLF